MNDDLTDAQVDELLSRFDQTEPGLQRRIVARFVVECVLAKADVANAREQIARLELLLIRKNEALSLFADPNMWDWEPVDHSKIWTWAGDGGGAYRNPVEFAKREMETDEPC